MGDATENLHEVLKPFYQRAAEAEERISRLEAALASKQDGGNEDLVKRFGELQSKLEDANAELASEQRKVEALTRENEKQKYRMEHLVRALREADEKVERMSGQISGSSEQIVSRLKEMKI